MKLIGILAALLACFSAHAGVIYGSVTKDNQPLKKSELIIACANEPYSGQTDELGSYSVSVRETGRCELRVQFGTYWAEGTVFSRDSAARNDFEVVEDSEGSWILRRK